MAKTGRRSGGRAAVRLGAGAQAARSAERTLWASSVGGRRHLDRRRQALLQHSLRRPLREGTGDGGGFVIKIYVIRVYYVLICHVILLYHIICSVTSNYLAYPPSPTALERAGINP